MRQQRWTGLFWVSWRAFSAVYLLCGVAGAVQAQRLPTAAATGDEPAEYRGAIELAIAEYELGNFAEARAQFRKAHELYPNARSFRGLGMTEFELRNYGDAIADLEQALASEVKPLNGALRGETEQLLAKARGYVARLKLELEPGAASVVVDGVPVELAASGLLVLEVGDHVLEFRAPGLRGEKRPVKVTGGEERTLRIVLHEDTPGVEGRAWYKNKWLWTAVGVVVAGAATGAAIALSGSNSQLTRPEGGTTGVSLQGPP